MTLSTATPPAQISLNRGDQAAVPVPEGLLILRDTADANELAIVLEPHGGREPHELARFKRVGGFDFAQMVTVALAALEAWR